MVEVFDTLEEARAARETLHNKVRGFLTLNYIRKTLDGKFAIISIPASCWLSPETLKRYNLPSTTLGCFDEGEPEE